MGGGLQVLLDLWLMLGVCSLSVLGSCIIHCSFLLLFMVVKKKMSRIRAVQMVNPRGLPGIRRMDKIPNARIKELSGMAKCVDERIDEGVLRWFGHVERMENDWIAKRLYVGVCW